MAKRKQSAAPPVEDPQAVSDKKQRKKAKKSGAEKRREKKVRQAKNKPALDIHLDPDFQFGDAPIQGSESTGGADEVSQHRQWEEGQASTRSNTSSTPAIFISDQDSGQAESQADPNRQSTRARDRSQKKLAKRGSDRSKEKEEAQLVEQPVYEEQMEKAPGVAPDTENGLTDNHDFISLNFDDDVDAESTPEEENEGDKPTAFANIAEKLGKFVKESNDPGKRQRNDDTQSRKSRKRKRETLERDPYPWLQGVSYAQESEPARILHREILDFVRYVGPTTEEHRVRTFVVSRVRRLVEEKWPTASLHVFGSFDTKLYLPTSDIDLVVLSGQDGELYEKPNHLRRLANWLVKARIAENIQVITSARVPIIKFIDTVTKINVDISFNKPSGLIAAGVVKKYTETFPALRPLVIFVKHFLNMRGMNEVYLGGLGSYSIICMAISFLQRHPKIASGQIQQEQNLGVLVVEFFELYGKRFNYDNVGININGSGSYFNKLDYGWQRPGQTFLLSIEDPTDPENDIAKSSFGILKVKSTLGGGHDFLVQRLYDVNDRIKERRRADVGLDSILSAVVSIDEDMKESRAFIASCFDSDVVQQELTRMDDSDGEIHEVPVYDGSHTTRKSKKPNRPPTFIEEDESDDELIDDDGHVFLTPDGYKKPSNPADVDDLYTKLNVGPSLSAPSSTTTTAAITAVRKSGPITTGNGTTEAYLIESSDEESKHPRTTPDSRDVINLDTDEDELEDSKIAQVDRGARSRYWESKGKEVTNSALIDEPSNGGTTNLIDYDYESASGDDYLR